MPESILPELSWRPHVFPMDSEQDTRAWRRETRARLIGMRLAIGAELRRRSDTGIERNLRSLLDISATGVVGLYWPVKGEFDPRPLADHLLRNGRSVALPVIIARGGLLEYRLWQPGMEMEDGLYDIPAPKSSCILHPDIVLVPLVGFDAMNYRLGYGGGYFDRTLAAFSPRPKAIGVGYEVLGLPTTFPQAHDIPMDAIVTERGVHRAGSKG
jgi:5-formyltetrahydrofolate cyclo-ligase